MMTRFLLAATLVFCLAGCSWEDDPPRPVTHVVIVTDRSDGIERGDGAACRAVHTLAREALTQQRSFSELNIRRGGTQVMLYGTADASDPGTPRPLHAGFEVPKGGKGGLESRQKQARQYDAELSGELESLQRACTQHAAPQMRSPVYSAVKAGVGWLERQLADPLADGLLIVQSDLVENYEKPISEAVRHLVAGTAVGSADAIRREYGIDLKGRIAVHVCGTAQGTDVRQEGPRQRVVNFWKDNLLLNAKSWEEQPTCSGYLTEAGGDKP